MGISLIGFGSFNSVSAATAQITKFEVKIENISNPYEYISSGIFQGLKPGPVGPG
ncbi:MAG: hypothetical protein QG641_2503, partial [Candidatus Poribacteria bacterium]|nr:hypothetical protein [Candidatus Poribacteria bacterium]